MGRISRVLQLFRDACAILGVDIIIGIGGGWGGPRGGGLWMVVDGEFWMKCDVDDFSYE